MEKAGAMLALAVVATVVVVTAVTVVEKTLCLDAGMGGGRQGMKGGLGVVVAAVIASLDSSLTVRYHRARKWNSRTSTSRFFELNWSGQRLVGFGHEVVAAPLRTRPVSPLDRR